MNTSSPARIPSGQEVESRDYRRDRQHLYPFENYDRASVMGGVVRSFCGIDVLLPSSASNDVVEATTPEEPDCVTCVDVWLGRRLVRL